MSQKTKKILIFLIALSLSFWVLIFLPYYAHIGESDDVLVAGLMVIPAFIISVVLCLVLVTKESWILSLILTLFNSLNALLAVYMTHEQIMEVLSLKNNIYDGKSDYTSFQIFIIGIIPAMLAMIAWGVLFYKFKGRTKSME